MIKHDTTRAGRITRLRTNKDTGIDRLWSWAQRRGIAPPVAENLEEKWEALRDDPAAEKPQKILDLHFGITGGRNTLREVARQVGLPAGSVSGKLYAAAKMLFRTEVKPKPTFEQTFPFIGSDMVETVTFQPSIGDRRRANPVAQWSSLPKWQREHVYRALLRLQEEARAAVQEHSRMRLSELSEDSRQIEGTAEIALRVLGFDVGAP